MGFGGGGGVVAHRHLKKPEKKYPFPFFTLDLAGRTWTWDLDSGLSISH